MYNKSWDNCTHVIGKDILRFHSIYWIIELMALANIDTKTPPPSGNMILTLNGKNASFMDMLHEGDSVIIRWDV